MSQNLLTYINIDKSWWQCLEKQSKCQKSIYNTSLMCISLQTHRTGVYSLCGYICMWSRLNRNDPRWHQDDNGPWGSASGGSVLKDIHILYIFKFEGKNGNSLNLGVVHMDLHLFLCFLIYFKCTFWIFPHAFSLCRDSLCFNELYS